MPPSLIEITAFLSNWGAYLAIPFISAIVGWATNVLAVQMTFYPLEFKGIPPYFGWQGIIPNKSLSMAEKSVDLITTKLIDIDQQFQNLDSDKIAFEMKLDLERISEKIVNEVMEAKMPLLWKTLPNSKKQKIFLGVKSDLPILVNGIFEEIKGSLKDHFDITEMVKEALVNDKALLNEIFLKCGSEEFRFIKKSGFYFGFLFGLIQMIVWYFWPFWWILPVAGLLVGYFTNWIALNLIFSPLHPIKVGPFILQGLFIKRQKEVAGEYSKLVTENIITSENIISSLLDGPKSNNLKVLIEDQIKLVIDDTFKDYNFLLGFFYKAEKMVAIKNIAAYTFIEDLPIVLRNIYNYVESVLDVENILRLKMSSLPPKDFSGFLRPIFQEDEWKLIAVGGVLGMIAGFGQYILLF